MAATRGHHTSSPARRSYWPAVALTAVSRQSALATAIAAAPPINPGVSQLTHTPGHCHDCSLPHLSSPLRSPELSGHLRKRYQGPAKSTLNAMGSQRTRAGPRMRTPQMSTLSSSGLATGQAPTRHPARPPTSCSWPQQPLPSQALLPAGQLACTPFRCNPATHKPSPPGPT